MLWMVNCSMKLKVLILTAKPVSKIKGDASECFRIDNGGGQGCIMSPWFFNVYMDAVCWEVKMEMRRRGES